MGKGMFRSFKEGIKQGLDEVVNEPEKVKAEREEKKEKKRIDRQERELENISRLEEELSFILGDNEKILESHTFIKNKIIITNKKFIYLDVSVARNKAFMMIPFDKVTSYSLLIPTGLSAKGKLKIFTGGDSPAIEIESIMNEGMNRFCKKLADII